MRTIPLLHVLGAALTASSGIVVPSLWIGAVLGLGWFFYIVWYATRTYREAFWYGSVFGLITSGAGIIWFWDTLPLTWLGIEHVSTEYYVVFATWFLVSFFLAIPIGLGAMVLRYVRTNVLIAFAAALAWVAIEELRMWSFALITLGAESLVGPHFSIAAFGYSLAAESHLLQLASFGGVAFLNGVCALFAASSALGVRALEERTMPLPVRGACLASIVVIVTALFVSYDAPPVRESLSVALVSTAVPIGTIEEADIPHMLRGIVPYPDVVLIPEGRKITREELSLASDHEVLFMHAQYAIATTSAVAQIRYESTEDGLLGTYEKMFLMPEGEYAPYFSELFFSVAGDKRLNEYITNLETTLKRGTRVTPLTYQGVTFGALLCSDMLSPHLYRSLASTHNVSVLVSLANTSWFHDSQTLFAKTIEVAKVHAVYNRAYVLQAANGSPSFAIDPRGVVIAQTTWGVPSVITVQVPVVE